MADFIKMTATGGTPLGDYIVPIKRTFTHKELEKKIEIAQKKNISKKQKVMNESITMNVMKSMNPVDAMKERKRLKA